MKVTPKSEYCWGYDEEDLCQGQVHFAENEDGDYYWYCDKHGPLPEKDDRKRIPIE